MGNYIISVISCFIFFLLDDKLLKKLKYKKWIYFGIVIVGSIINTIFMTNDLVVLVTITSMSLSFINFLSLSKKYIEYYSVYFFM